MKPNLFVTHGHRLLKPLLPFAVGLALCSCQATPTPVTAPTPDNRFAYDRAAPLQVNEVGQEIRGEAVIRDITFVPVDKPVKAFLVTPREAKGPHAAILYLHWLGEPATTNRTQFLDEAVQLSGRGVVSLLIDTMWAKPDWYKNRIPEEDYANALRQVIEIRRSLDLLLAQPGLDSARVAFVGHDFGAMYGTLALAQEPRVKTVVLMAGVPHFIDWFLFARQPKDPLAYRAQLGPLDPVYHVGRLAPTPVFFQFAGHDDYVSPAQAAAFFAAATGPRKQMTVYDAGHDLHTPEVAADRVAWLSRELGLK
jgi:pimeloyl-ACP methyl ester carboxylesterase